MRIFLTGANGYIGGAVACALIAAGHQVRGLVRSSDKADAVKAHGIEPVIGSLDDTALLQAEARAAGAVINAASSDHRGAAEALIAALADHIVKPAFVYRHQWRVGDLLMWDNCTVQHRAIQDYDLPQRRLMHRTTMGGAVPA